jgi:hypothetical protein
MATKRNQLIARLALMAAGLLLAVASGVNALENAARAGNPAATLRTSPADAGALTAQADALLLSPDGKLDHGRAMQLSRAALKSQAIEPRALRMLAFSLDKPPTQAQTASLITLSTRVSRRDLWARIWLNEKSATSGDVPAAISHYDIALRTNPTAGGQILFPILTEALAEVEVQNALVPYVKNRAPWVYDFVQHWSAKQKDTRPLANAIIKAGGLPDEPKYASVQVAVMRMLENGNAYTELRQMHATIKGADPKSLVTADLNQANTDPRFAGVSWTFPDTQGLKASAGLSEGQHRMTVIVSPRVRTIAARKLLYLPPGNYRFSTMTRFGANKQNTNVQWILKCGGQSTLAPAMTLNIAQASPAQSNADIAIRPGCAPQYLDLLVKADGNGGDGEVFIDSVAIRPTAS